MKMKNIIFVRINNLDVAKEFTQTVYTLQSVLSGEIFPDTGWLLDPPEGASPSLVRAIYEKKQLEVGDPSLGLYKFADWMPVMRVLDGSSAPVTYRSKDLARELGLENLWVTFSGYWPERGAFMKTCSFKETEAYSVCGRLEPGTEKILVVASAGNTARSFAEVCSDNLIPLLLCVPLDNVDALWFDHPIDPCVQLVVSCKGSDYFDAIHLSNMAVRHPAFLPEGGARNIARRDGMGTTVLSAVTTIGQIPEYYFQAVGSGTGAIAAWEANLRLIADGRFGSNKMKLMVSQNSPFTPIHEAWKAGSRSMLPLDDDLARKQIEEIDAKVLSNRKPPYPIAGGLYDALSDTHGDVLLATNTETREAAALFQATEGVDIHPAAAVATATLIKAVKEKKIDHKAIIMLNITGGGEEKFRTEKDLFFLEPSHIFHLGTTEQEVIEKIGELY
jgi:cysteate synthase